VSSAQDCLIDGSVRGRLTCLISGTVAALLSALDAVEVVADAVDSLTVGEARSDSDGRGRCSCRPLKKFVRRRAAAVTGRSGGADDASDASSSTSTRGRFNGLASVSLSSLVLLAHEIMGAIGVDVRRRSKASMRRSNTELWKRMSHQVEPCLGYSKQLTDPILPRDLRHRCFAAAERR
jgi:hypothetical protein